MTSSTSLIVDPAVLASDDRLAEAIETDARELIASGLDVNMERYVSMIPDLASRSLAADAAIEFVLRSATRRGLTEEDAARAIAATDPRFAMAVHRAVILNQWCGGSSVAKTPAIKPPPLTLPCELGPFLTSGRRRYEVREKLGDGAQGVVYLAHDRSLSEPDRLALVAIKRHGDRSTLEWTEDEATRARRVAHPSVVRVLDRGISPDGWSFVVMEYVDGGTLDAASLRAKCRASTNVALTLVSQVADGVHAAHLAGLVHCDLKPTNVLVSKDGTPKTSDFGLSVRLGQPALSGSGPAGSWGFGAPELLRGEPGGRSIPADVYGLAALLFSLLTGQPPNGSSVEAAQRWASDDDLALIEWRKQLLKDLPTDVKAVVVRSLAWSPARRHGSAESFASDLRAVLAYQPLEWTRPSPLRRARLFARRRPSVVAIGVTALAAAMVGTGVVVRMQGQAELLSVELNASQRIQVEQVRRLDQEQQHRVAMKGVIDSTLQVFTPVIKKELNATAWSPTLTVLESVLDVDMMGKEAAAHEREWNQQRVIAGRKTLDELVRSCQGESMEALLWRDAIAFWSLRIDDHQTALTLLDEGEGGATRLVSPSDRWSVVRKSLRLVAEAQRCEQCSAETRDSLLRRLESARDELRSFGQTGGLVYLVEKTVNHLSPTRADAIGKVPDPKLTTEMGTR